MDDSRGNNKYDMILGRRILSKLQIDLCFSDNIIWLNVGAYKGCTDPIKDVTNMTSSANSHDEAFRDVGY